jgi:hypothetical protein
MLKYQQTQSRNTTLTVGAAVGSLPTTGQVQLQVNGNNNYKNLVGVMLLISDSAGNQYTKKALVSISTTSGIVILPEQPYACIRPSFAEKPSDRIIPVENVAGYGHDIRFQVSIPNSEAEQKSFDITAICYFTNR